MEVVNDLYLAATRRVSNPLLFCPPSTRCRPPGVLDTRLLEGYASEMEEREMEEREEGEKRKKEE